MVYLKVPMGAQETKYPDCPRIDRFALCGEAITEEGFGG
jgi:hypothetical protein